MLALSRRAFGASALAFAAAPAFAGGVAPPAFRAAAIGSGLRLNYVEQGQGSPLIFVHGSLSDYTYWKPQFPYFTPDHRVIAYSRRYNWPNHNPARPDYSAIADADDLAAFIDTLKLRKPVIVGHSYGALTALFFAVRHPDIARALVLAEAPAVSLLEHIEGPDAAKGKAMSADIEANMVAPMRAAFAKGEREKGVAIFIDYVYRDPHKWDSFSAADKADTMKDAHEWDVMMTAGKLFPAIAPESVRAIKTPVLMFSGAQSYPFLGVIDAQIARLLPHVQRFIIPGVGHQMWLQKGDFCRAQASAFLKRLPA
ncbi:MAG: alpha/beta fold hydrolase [Rhizomicrobium sp.]